MDGRAVAIGLYVEPMARSLAIPARGVAPCCLRPTRAAVRRAAGLKPSGREHGTAAGAHSQATRDGGDKGELQADRREEAIACEHQRMWGTERHGRSTSRDIARTAGTADTIRSATAACATPRASSSTPGSS